MITSKAFTSLLLDHPSRFGFGVTHATPPSTFMSATTALIASDTAGGIEKLTESSGWVGSGQTDFALRGAVCSMCAAPLTMARSFFGLLMFHVLLLCFGFEQGPRPRRTMIVAKTVAMTAGVVSAGIEIGRPARRTSWRDCAGLNRPESTEIEIGDVHWGSSLDAVTLANSLDVALQKPTVVLPQFVTPVNQFLGISLVIPQHCDLVGYVQAFEFLVVDDDSHDVASVV